jgi:hypothetical protein
LMDQVADGVFPHRALEIQKLWMHQGMRNAMDMSMRKTAAAITEINNSLLLIPDGTNGSKFTDQELVGLIEWSFPPNWARSSTLRAMFPLSEQMQSAFQNAKQSSGTRPWIRSTRRPMMTTTTTGNQVRKICCESPKKWTERQRFFCKNCWSNCTRDTSKCYFLKDKTQRFNGKTSDNNKEAGQKERPFSRRTFRKEVNTIARKASKKGALGVYASVLKRQQDKESKAIMAKRCAEEMEDSSSLEDFISVNNVEKPVPHSLAKPIPCKIIKRAVVAQIKVAKEDKKKAYKRTEKEGALSEAVNSEQHTA